MPITIDIEVANKQTDSALSRLEKALKRLEAVQDRLNDSLRQTAQYANSAAGAYVKMASSAQRASTATKSGGRPAPPPIQDPFQAQHYAQHWMKIDPGNPAALRMFNQAQRKINAGNPANQLKTALMRTRFTPNGVGLPLGVDLLKHGPQLFGMANAGGSIAGGVSGMGSVASGVMGVASKLGAWGAVIAASIAGMAAFVAAANKAAQYLSEVGRGLAAAGSNVQGLTPFSQVAGLGGGAGAARGLQSALESGYGTGFGVRLGINPVGGPFGNNDYGTKLRMALRGIAGVGKGGARSFDDSRRMAEGLGMPEAANLYNTSGYIKQRIGVPIAKVRPEDVRAANDFMVAIGRFLELMSNRLGRTFGPMLDRWAKQLTFWTEALAKFFEWIDQIVDRVNKALGINTSSNKNSAQERNTQAVNDNTRAMHGLKETLGGGVRARGAMPGGINGLNYGQAKDMRLGAV